jgi:hypothetical protein
MQPTCLSREIFRVRGNGYINSFTDWSGNVTNFTNNSSKTIRLLLRRSIQLLRAETGPSLDTEL